MAVSALIVYADDFVADVGYGVVGPGTVRVFAGSLPSQFRCLVEERCGVEEWCGVARQLEDAKNRASPFQCAVCLTTSITLSRSSRVSKGPDGRQSPLSNKPSDTLSP